MAKVSSSSPSWLVIIDDVHSTKDGAQYYVKAHRYEVERLCHSE